MTGAHRFALPAFLISHGGKSLLWTAGDAFALYILIVLVRLPPLIAGIVFLAASIWNAALDALWGAALARIAGLQRSVPAIGAAAALIACASLAALPWLKPGSTIMAAGLLLLFRTAFALFDVPHNAVAAALAERTGHLRVMRLRTIGSAAAALLVAAAAIPLLAARDMIVSAGSITAIGALAFLCLTPLSWLLARPPCESRAPAPLSTGGIERSGAGAVLAFSLLHAVGIGALAVIGKAVLHLEQAPPGIVTIAPLLIMAMRLPAVPLWSTIAGKVGITAALMLAYAAAGIAMIALPAALTSGFVIGALGLATFGTTVGGVVLLIWSAFSQLLERLGGSGTPGRAASRYGIMTATMKIGLGGSAYIASYWLAGPAGHADIGAASLATLAAWLAAAMLACAVCEWWRASAALGKALPTPDPIEAPDSPAPALYRVVRSAPRTSPSINPRQWADGAGLDTAPSRQGR